jgi:cyclin H
MNNTTTSQPLIPVKMNEDDRYRTSSQYKYWSFTPSSLAALRAKTNELATKRVKAAYARVAASRAASAAASAETSEAERSGTPVALNIPDGEINCLTPEEELKLMRFFAQTALQLADHLKLPTDVKVSFPPLPPFPIARRGGSCLHWK